MRYDVAWIGPLVCDVMTKPVDVIPESGKLERVNSIELFTGGCSMNVCVDLCKIGIKTTIVGKVGNDAFGDFLKNSLAACGAGIDGIQTDARLQTSASVVLSASGGERSFLHCVGVNASFSDADVDWDVIEKSDIVFVGGTMLMDAFDGEPCARVYKRAQEMGKITVLDTAWDSQNRWMSVLGPCLKYVDYFLPSVEEARAASGKEDMDAIADFFFDYGVRHVVIKNGKHGAYMRYSRDSEPLNLPTYNSAPVVDTTGAGDSFCAGFLAGLARGMSFEDCGRLANAVGTFCVGAKGASTGIRSLDEIQRYMQEHKPGE